MIGDVPVADDELLARFIFHRSHVRSDGTVRPEVFIPYKKVEMSVTRHLELLDSELWRAGELVAHKREATLAGRADNQAVTFRNCGLRVVPTPLNDNPNHADVIDWPAEKSDQKLLALLIAKEARFVSIPKP